MITFLSIGTPEVETDLLPDEKRGTVAIAAVQFDVRYWAAAEIVPGQAGNTHVTVWNYVHGWDYIGPPVQKWAAGATKCCSWRDPTASRV